MKRILCLAAAALVAAGMAFAGTITVTQPAGGSVVMGSACTIAWTATGITSNVRIRLLHASGGLVEVLEDNWPASGSPYTWTVDAPAVAGQSYQIHIKAIDNSGEGRSEAFTVTDAPEEPVGPGASISVIEPNTSSTWPVGSSQAIIWQKIGEMPNMVQLTLRREGAPESESPALRIADGTANNGRWSGRISASLAPGRYFLRVRASDAVKGDSAPFTVAAADASSGTSITVTSPLAADRWCIGEERGITWRKTGSMHGFVAITLRRLGSYNSQPDALTITTNTANDGNFNFWRIPASLPTGEYFIRVRTNERGTEHVTGESALFTVCAEGGSSTAAPTVIADLELAGVGVEYFNGNIVAWVKNNGPEDVFQDVKFLLNFPEQSGGGHYITKRINVPVGQERSVQLQPLAEADIPDAGLRTNVMIETTRSGIQDPNLHNQHRDVRLGGLDIRLTMPRSDFSFSKLYLQGGWDYSIFFRIYLRHNLSRNVNNIRVFYMIDTQGGAVSIHQESFTIDSLQPGGGVGRGYQLLFGKSTRSNAHTPMLTPGASYRIWARIEDPDNALHDINPDNNRASLTFTCPD